jgi:monofunctional biosynthetic peptidoglycan transglycosylase
MLLKKYRSFCKFKRIFIMRVTLKKQQGGSLKKVFNWFLPGTTLFGLVAGSYLYLSLPDVTNLKTKNPATTALIEHRIEEAHQAHKNFNIRQQWVDFNAIPALLKDTIRISEDAAFYEHHGIDFVELSEAIKKDWHKGKYVRGGSTITQQLAKNLYLNPKKSIIRKIKEYFIAKRLESTLRKKRIFHLYLNVIELGPGIFGVEAASRYYFNKNVGDLDLEEIVRLTAVIPKPLKIKPTGSSRWLKWKAGWILDTLKKNNYISPSQYQRALNRIE